MVTTFLAWSNGWPAELSLMTARWRQRLLVHFLLKHRPSQWWFFSWGWVYLSCKVHEVSLCVLNTEGVQSHKWSKQSFGLKTTQKKCVQNQRGHWCLLYYWDRCFLLGLLKLIFLELWLLTTYFDYCPWHIKNSQNHSELLIIPQNSSSRIIITPTYDVVARRRCGVSHHP